MADTLDKFRDASGNIDTARLADAYRSLEKMGSRGRQSHGRTVDVPTPPQSLQEAPRAAQESQPSRGSAEAPTTAPEPPQEPTAPPAASAEPVPLPKGFTQSDIDQLMSLGSQDWFKNGGKLSDDFLRYCESKGISRQTVSMQVNGILAMQQLEAQQRLAIVHAETGSPQQSEEMIRWAQASWTPEQMQTFNAAYQSGNPSYIRLAAKDLKAAYHDAMGDTRPLPLNAVANVAGGIYGGRGGIQPFTGPMDMVAAMSDPRYAKSEDYRKEVSDRVGASLRAGTLDSIRVRINGGQATGAHVPGMTGF